MKIPAMRDRRPGIYANLLHISIDQVSAPQGHRHKAWRFSARNRSLILPKSRRDAGMALALSRQDRGRLYA
jgi:hypothetical protein